MGNTPLAVAVSDRKPFKPILVLSFLNLNMKTEEVAGKVYMNQAKD